MLKREALPRLRGGLWHLSLKALAIAVLLIAGTAAGLQASAAAVPNSGFVVDAKSGKILYSSNADAQRHPASLTKMMTLYLLFDSLAAGKTSLTTRMPVSAFAAAQAPSKLGLKPGQTIAVRDAILAIVTKSANDVAVVIAEYLGGGSEKNFAAQMTKRARGLGMSRTIFVNASGLPDSRQLTSARDMATLGRALRDHFPQYYSYFSTPSFVWQGRRIANHNGLLRRVEGVNGIKTGYTRASGYNLVTSVDRDNRMLVAVVLGGASTKARDNRMAGLIEKYLPQAIRGARTAKFMPGGPTGVASEPVQVASTAVPMPRPRPTMDAVDDESDAPVAVAAVNDNTAAPAPVANTAPKPFAKASLASVIGANSIFALDATDGTDADESAQGDNTTDDEDQTDASSTVVPGGWRIQIAAAPTQAGAEDILDQALSKGGKILASAAPYTEAVQSGETKLYRARFAGFVTKEAARAACDYLTKQQFSCLAVSN